MVGWPLALPPRRARRAETPSGSFSPPQDHPVTQSEGSPPATVPTADGGHLPPRERAEKSQDLIYK